MKDILEYILLPKEDRQAHLKLDEACIERGGPQKGGLSSYCKGLLAHVLDTTIPTGHKIHICHACNNERCSKPEHLYWGTARENRMDQIDTGSDRTIWQRTVDKYGIAEASRKQRRPGNKNFAGNNNK